VLRTAPPAKLIERERVDALHAEDARVASSNRRRGTRIRRPPAGRPASARNLSGRQRQTAEPPRLFLACLLPPAVPEDDTASHGAR